MFFSFAYSHSPNTAEALALQRQYGFSIGVNFTNSTDTGLSTSPVNHVTHQGPPTPPETPIGRHATNNHHQHQQQDVKTSLQAYHQMRRTDLSSGMLVVILTI
jgi:hypothetical protein